MHILESPTTAHTHTLSTNHMLQKKLCAEYSQEAMFLMRSAMSDISLRLLASSSPPLLRLKLYEMKLINEIHTNIMLKTTFFYTLTKH